MSRENATAPSSQRRQWFGIAAGRLIAASVALAVAICASVAASADPSATHTDPPSTAFRDCAVCPELVAIPAGRFTLGSPPGEPGREAWDKGSESPATVVQIARPFALGKTAVTRGQFRLFTAATGYRSFGGCHTFDGRDWTLWAGVTWWTTDIEQDDDHPVVCIDHADAMAYIGWLNAITRGARYRLPSEAEREYAARAGTFTAFWWGDTISLERANYDASLPSPIPSDPGSTPTGKRTGTIPAAALGPNPWGLHQVHGNVWEWMADCYVPSYADLPGTVIATGAARVDSGCDRRSLRGGAWNRPAHTLRAAYRTGLDPAFRGHSIGFRVAREMP